MDDLHGDRSEKQALNTTEASRSHYDLPDAFVVSCLRDRFRRLSGSDDALKTDSGPLSFSNRLLKGLSRCLRNCLRNCLQTLSPDNRQLILQYYQGEKGEKIQNRKKLIERLGVPVNTLRMRALRLRERLQSCVEECLARS